MEEVMQTEQVESESTRKIRTFEAVDELVEKAKLNKNELYPSVQNIYLGGSLANDEFKLLEVDEEKLKYLLEGNSLIIRGGENDNAVCCSNNSTFSFKVAEVSNPLLITPNLSLPNKETNDLDSRMLKNVDVSFITSCYFTMVKEKPKLLKLRNLLEMNLYCGKAFDQNSDAAKFTMNDLLNMIQSSEDEMYHYLNYIEAYKIDGYWRLLDYKYYNELMDNILKLVDEKGWSCDEIPIKEVYNELQGLYGMAILNQVVNYYFQPKEEDKMINGLKKEKICRFYAETLLKTTIKMRYTEFVTILKKSFPNNFNFEFNLAQIQDMCYVEEPYIYYLNVLDLPDDIEKRIKYLFDKRKKWNYDEIRAFISDLCSNDTTEINNMLTKYCRPFTQNNVKYFTSRI